MKEKIIYYLGIVSLVVLSLSLAIFIIIWSFPLFRLNLALFNLHELVGLSPNQIMADYRNLIAYLNFPWINDLSLTYFPMSDSARFHFYEVKQLFLFNDRILLFTAIFSIIFINYLNKKQGLWQLAKSFKVLQFLPLLVILVLLFNFNQVFTTFHHIFFDNDAWLFNPSTDPIILVLNDSFFLLCFVGVFILLQLFLWLFYRLGLTQLKNNRER
ncbi:TIGR01906 family membrane protein [Aerococcus kribbianus]|uniref:TIGR01906 family membrane protein n=1 Tax=Aerococcus kribbianus TaxID=2999064 RepID=A0A9X3FN75_9LACT|nr:MULTISPECIES: TIGR01906 family membrane protein [unclassified Aerococcus]MCZ0717642.1 TIGR01906 family membrane protein [Aerococcus sp. YH-aer221]MCZ0725930.1 TIGR01906 family membrane protein [Aerococcus sp. YH-aer222]